MLRDPLGPAQDELGGAAPDVHDQRRGLDRPTERHSLEGEVSLLVAAEKERGEAVVLLDLGQEGRTVLGVADGAGGHG